MALLIIDGAAGEGGGQILRSSLALSLVTGRPFRIERIRAGRKKPGLLRQHLTAVRAATAVSAARVTGAELESQTLTFEPSQVKGGEFLLSVGTAGSATLVLQTVLPALLLAPDPSRLTLEGGTHNPAAPPFEFLSRTFLPTLRRMGASVEITLERYGFYPAGGGRFVAAIQPGRGLTSLTLLEQGARRMCARSLVASLPENIGKRELAVVRDRLKLDRALCHVESIDASIGPGNVLMIIIESETATEVITGFGMKGVSAEQVAADACDEAQRFLASDAPVGRHLADQLLIPMALAGGGTFRTLEPTPHTVTNATVIQKFVDVTIGIEPDAGRTYRITVASPARIT